MATRYIAVDFGAGAGGLSTVGYALYNASDGSAHTARTTTGVTELGTSTGIYIANFNASESENIHVVWDDGESTATYAIQESFSQLTTIQSNCDKIGLIQNTIKNMADFNGEMMLRLAKMNDMQLNPDQIGEAFTKTLQGHDFSDQFKQTDLDMSKFEKGQLRVIDEVVRSKNESMALSQELRKIIGEIDPKVSRGQKSLLSSLGAVEKKLEMMAGDKTTLQTLQKMQADNRELISALEVMVKEVNKGNTDTILRSGAENLQSEMNALNGISNVLQRIQDRSEGIIDLKSAVGALDSKTSMDKQQLLMDITGSLQTLKADLRTLEVRFQEVLSQVNAAMSRLGQQINSRNKADVISAMPFLAGKRRGK